MKIIKHFYFLILLSNINSLSRGLFFNKEKCFYEYLYKKMNMVFTYEILDKDINLSESQKTFFKIYVQLAENPMTFKYFFGSKLKGKFSYNIEKNGKYKICILSNDKEIFKNKTFLHLDFRLQSSEEIYSSKYARGKDFKKVNNTISLLFSKVNFIEKIQNYEIEVEDKFSDKQIGTSKRLLFLTVFQIIIICIFGFYHILSLRRQFKNKILTLF